MIRFICVGVQKAGTTTLHDILSQHPDIYLPEIKETHFFDKEDLFINGTEWYYKTFFSNAEDRICGEITPDYSFFEEAIKRISDNIPNAKIIVIFRNPVERAISHYFMSKSRGFENLDFNSAIREEEKRIKLDYFHRSNFSYIARGKYSDQYKLILKYFNSEHVLPLIFEKDIVTNLDITLEKILKFIGATPFEFKTNLKSNSSKKTMAPRISKLIMQPPKFLRIITSQISKNPNFKYKIKVWLNDRISTKNKDIIKDEIKKAVFEKYFVNDIIKLEGMLKRDLSHWHF